MTAKEKFLTQRQRYQPLTLAQDFSDEEMSRDWTLMELDKQEVGRYRTNSRLFVSVNLTPSSQHNFAMAWCAPDRKGRYNEPVE